ncbi:hypothetical protein FSP39_022107 [Pinctada imbricata]|uniref:EF-hand domain-containing protein n=1 Tax=Pinctada imbricata TaxID=66713 RepID=A0AA88XTS9_PINIB|nr:hypothetical protein FSP39_022107 [Pinctada imbricata]
MSNSVRPLTVGAGPTLLDSDSDPEETDQQLLWQQGRSQTHIGADTILRVKKRIRNATEQKRRKSFSNPENIENFGDKDKTLRLEEQIKLDHLKQLMDEFLNHKPPDIVKQAGSAYFPAKTEKRTPGAMNMEEFKSTVAKVLKTEEYDEYLEKLFNKLDTSLDGYVDWNEFCTYMLLLYRENDYMRTKREIPFLSEPKIRHIDHTKQEQTTKIVATANPLRYVTVSKDSDQTGQKRRFKMWVTDAIFLPNCNKLVIGSTSRDIRFYDCSTANYFEEFQLFAMSDVPYCFDYWYDVKNPSRPSKLFFGVDTGYIHTLHFKKPVSQLFETPFKNEEGVQKIFWTDIEKGNHESYVTHEKILHGEMSFSSLPDIVKQVMYLPENEYIISSTSSPKQSLVISPCDKKDFKKSYIFDIEKGIESFDYNKNLNILVTGSLDHLVRIWNPYVTNKAMAILEGHATGVIGVIIHEGLIQVFSYSKDAVVKVWDIKEHTCLQTIVLKFPSSIHGRMPEHGQFPMHLQPSPHDTLLVTCNDHVGMLKLGHTSQPKMLEAVTHDTQLCSAIYNKLFNQIVTGCDSSNVAVWELESGNKSIVFSNTHGDEEITCMAFDQTYRRLFTGARNGTIKVWNFQNGHNLHKLEPVSEAEITGILPYFDRKMILAVGWGRKLIRYDDSDPDNMYIPAQLDWKGGQIHQDDILAMDFAMPNYLATAGFDGEIVVWDIETEKIFIRLRKGQQADISKKIEEIQAQTSFISVQSTESIHKVNGGSKPVTPSRLSRPNSRHRKSHKIPKGQPAPVEKLLFLPKRLSSRISDGAMLISSEAGYLKWWCLFGAKKEVGYFYVPDTKDESVLGLCSDSENQELYTGDTQGQIQVWDISNYCMCAEERRIKTKPPLIRTWKAHDSSIVSLEYIEHETGNYIVSASTDFTARLWSVEGEYVGTFGQKKSWNLKQKSTWMHPRTPWSTKSVISIDDSKNERKDSRADSASGFKTPGADKDDVTMATKDSDQSNGVMANGKLDKDKTGSSKHGTESRISKDGTKEEITVRESSRLEKSEKSFISKEEDFKTFLGSKVAEQLRTIKESRIERRHRLSQDVNFKDTQRFGKICSPYQALKTKDVEEIKLPSKMPLSQRMINKGYTSDNMTQEKLLSMDFSYVSSDSPLPNDQTSKDREKVTEKVRTAGTHRRANSRQNLVKKSNTVA